MHQLGFDLPERTGLGGLWAGLGDEPRGRSAPAPETRHVVATSTGATSASVRRSIAAFLAANAPADHAAA